MPPRLTYLPAILWALASTAIWTLIFAAVKFADGAVGAFQLTFLRGIGSLAVLVPMALATGGLGQYRSRQPWAHLARTLCGTGAAVTITWASARMPLVDATAIAMLYGPRAVVLGVVELSTGNILMFDNDMATRKALTDEDDVKVMAEAVLTDFRQALKARGGAK